MLALQRLNLDNCPTYSTTSSSVTTILITANSAAISIYPIVSVDDGTVGTSIPIVPPH